ncbi:hypothetical protein O6H91_10G067800 [Diphasiastrum complanatum]|uniref:Uncharacterized protein n=1 Tax=Diphasiastrum complanatum TaxID=34168 RepID=A0ACC2CHX5_DIPCM|nr:hypothetical protein O6H91_10G067800 [Diphasiastrum complanatum]
MSSFFDKLSSIFGNGDTLPWTDTDVIQNCEREAAAQGVGISEASDQSESMMRLAWALVHSHQPADVQRGIAMLEAALTSKSSSQKKRETLYLLAVGQFRAGDYARSRRLVDQALEIAPDFRQAVDLKKMVEDKIAKDGMIGVGLAAAAVGIVASGIAAAVARKR